VALRVAFGMPELTPLPGVQRWVDQHGLISLGGFCYRVPIVLAGEPVEAVAAEHLIGSSTATCWSPTMSSGASPTSAAARIVRCDKAAAVPL